MRSRCFEMTIVEQRELERVRYWQGQLLRSRDFRVQMNTDSQLRAWHNRALHSAYGIALGYEITPLPDTGPLTGIRIEPGVAYDCFGRAIILVAEQVVLIPAAPSDGSGSMTLLLRYKEASRFPKPGETAGVCLTCCGALRRNLLNSSGNRLTGSLRPMACQRRVLALTEASPFLIRSSLHPPRAPSPSPIWQMARRFQAARCGRPGKRAALATRSRSAFRPWWIPRRRVLRERLVISHGYRDLRPTWPG